MRRAGKKEHKFLKKTTLLRLHIMQSGVELSGSQMYEGTIVLDEEISSYEEAVFFNGGIGFNG